MSILVNQIQTLAHQYVRSGSKANRRLQVGRMIKFVEFIEQTERLHNLHEIGRRHVLLFWKQHRDMAPKTAHAYWLALCVIWQWSDKPGTPPKPILFSQANTGQADFKEIHSAESLNQVVDSTDVISALPSLIEISRRLKAHRLSQALTVEAVSMTTGLDSAVINVIETGGDQARYIDIATLSHFYFTATNPEA
ncbi:MAG: hypothetical protein ABSB19_13625 [Methylomonas sp.]